MSAKCSPNMYGTPYIFYFVHRIVKKVEMMVQRVDFERNVQNIRLATVVDHQCTHIYFHSNLFRVLSASLQFVPAYGWTRAAVEAGTETLGYPTVTSGLTAKKSFFLSNKKQKKHHQIVQFSIFFPLSDPLLGLSHSRTTLQTPMNDKLRLKGYGSAIALEIGYQNYFQYFPTTSV